MFHRCLPLNLTAEDLASGVLRDRVKVGASLADVDPMNLDSSVSVWMYNYSFVEPLYCGLMVNLFSSAKGSDLIAECSWCVFHLRWDLTAWVDLIVTFMHSRKWLFSPCFTLRSLKSSGFSLPGEIIIHFALLQDFHLNFGILLLFFLCSYTSHCFFQLMVYLLQFL